MAFKIIERFQAVIALITCFAEGRTETAELSGVFRAASRTFFWNVEVIFMRPFFRRCNSVHAEFFPRLIGNPVRRPDGRDFGNYVSGNSFLLKQFNNILFNIKHCGTGRVGGCDYNFSFLIRNHLRFPNNPQFYDVDHGNFRIRNLGKKF